jgi:hypothetical protein
MIVALPAVPASHRPHALFDAIHARRYIPRGYRLDQNGYKRSRLFGLACRAGSRKNGQVQEDKHRLLLFGIAGLLAGIFVFGNGITENIFYDTLIAVALALAVAADGIRRALPKARWADALFVIDFALPAFTGIASTPPALTSEFRSWRKTPTSAEGVRGVRFLERLPGPIPCETCCCALTRANRWSTTRIS